MTDFSGLIAPMGMTMGPMGMPPMGVPPPGMQGMLGGMMAQQMLQQGVNVPFTSARKYLISSCFSFYIKQNIE